MPVADTSLAIRGQGIHKQFFDKPSGRTIRALDDVSIEIPPGTLTAFVGPDGAGKTTLLRLMAGLLRCDRGSLQVLGLEVAHHAQAIQDRISYMPQRFGLYEDLSVQENLDLYADLHGVPARQRVERYARLMAMTGLAPFTARPAGKLSGGMKQKLGLACTLVRSPQLLLLDEPTVGLDVKSRLEVVELVRDLVAKEGVGVLWATHLFDEVRPEDHVTVLHKGQVLADGLASQIAGGETLSDAFLALTGREAAA